jgi:hypothetical protein
MSTLDTVLAGVILDRRYPIVPLKYGVIGYGPWRIQFYAPPIPVRNCDWHWSHDGFDGADDSFDDRAGSCATFADALNECDICEDETA